MSSVLKHHIHSTAQHNTTQHSADHKAQRMTPWTVFYDICLAFQLLLFSQHSTFFILYLGDALGVR